MFNWEKVKDFGDAYCEYAKEGKVARVTLNRPETLNSVQVYPSLYQPRPDLSYPACNHWIDAWMVAEEDEEISVIILRGAGRAFCAGAYVGPGGLGEQYGRQPTQRHRLQLDRWTPDYERIFFYSSKATIAQVHGYAVGAGFRFALWCDLVIAAEGTGFHYVEPRMLGAYYPNYQYFILRMGTPSLANQIMLTGRWLSAEELYARGVIDAVVPLDKLEDEVERWSRAICQISKDSIAIGKRALHMGYDGLGVAQGWTQGYVMHTLGVQQRLDEGDYNIFRERKAGGSKGVITGREKRFQELGFNLKTPYKYHPGY